MELAIEKAVTSDLPVIVDCLSAHEDPSRLGIDEIVEIDHLTIAVHERMNTVAIRSATFADHLPNVVDTEGDTSGSSAQSAEIIHEPSAVKERVVNRVAGQAVARHLPGIVDTPAEAEIATETAEVRHHALAVQEGVTRAVTGCLAVSRHLSRIVDSGAVAVRSAQGSKIGH
ncbi:MAG TPA: hypothetical protein VJ693_19085, partial [Ideonella sp.]